MVLNSIGTAPLKRMAREFVLLPEGKYDFEVTGFERQRYTPGANSRMPACPMALLKLRVSSELGTATVEERLYLHSSAEWKLCQFFTAIGQRSRGERLVPNWRAVLGAKGRCEVTVRQWTDPERRDAQEQPDQDLLRTGRSFRACTEQRIWRRFLMGTTLRPYQEEARQAVEREWAGGVDKTLLVLPTGCGKNNCVF